MVFGDPARAVGRPRYVPHVDGLDVDISITGMTSQLPRRAFRVLSTPVTTPRTGE